MQSPRELAVWSAIGGGVLHTVVNEQTLDDLTGNVRPILLGTGGLRPDVPKGISPLVASVGGSAALGALLARANFPTPVSVGIAVFWGPPLTNAIVNLVGLNPSSLSLE